MTATPPNPAEVAEWPTPVESGGDVSIVSIWRGLSSDTVSDKSGKNIKDLDKGVQKMFDHFPPGEKK